MTLNREKSTTKLQISFGLDGKIMSIQEEELLVTWEGWSISWVYLAKVMKERITQPLKDSLSNDHNFDVIA